jgi:CRP-like cAMP-binding protein
VLRNRVPVSSLSSLLIFADCSDRLLRRLSHLGTEVHAKERQMLAKEGQTGREFYVIASGSAEVCVGERPVTTLERGDFFGEMALVDGKPRSASVVAMSPMTLYVFDPREFFTLLSDFPPVSRQILKGLATRLRHAQEPAAEPSHLTVLRGGA